MVRWVRWLVAVVAAAVSFGMVLWVVRSVSWGWLPEGEEARWGVAAAFAAVVAGGVLAAVGWWAGRQEQPGGRRMRARASGHGRVDQVGGHRGVAGGAGTAAPDDVQFDAKASGRGQIRQTGGDDFTGTGGAGAP